MSEASKDIPNETEDLEMFLVSDHIHYFGGYDYDSEWVGNHFVVAALDDGKDRNGTRLLVFSRDVMLKWNEEARNMWEFYQRSREYDDVTLDECFQETWPEA